MAPSSSGLGLLAFIQAIEGSTPSGVTEMIYIFHGDDTATSYQNFSLKIDEFKSTQKFKSDIKSFDLDSFDRFLNTASLFSEDKVIVIENFFSLLKNTLDKAVKLINQYPDFTYLFWQSKKIEAAKLRFFPSAEIQLFNLPEMLFSCLNSLRPDNAKDFSQKYQQLLSRLPFELIMFWFKNTLRRQLTTFSKFPENKLKDAYLQLINIDYKSKSGRLFEPKEMALERLMLTLMQ